MFVKRTLMRVTRLIEHAEHLTEATLDRLTERSGDIPERDVILAITLLMDAGCLEVSYHARSPVEAYRLCKEPDFNVIWETWEKGEVGRVLVLDYDPDDPDDVWIDGTYE
jgi:hypothetical protein